MLILLVDGFNLFFFEFSVFLMELGNENFVLDVFIGGIVNLLVLMSFEGVLFVDIFFFVLMGILEVLLFFVK